MSLLSRSELCIVIYPEQIVLLSMTRQRTLRGYRRKLDERLRVACDESADIDAPWSRAFRALEKTLPAFVKRNMQTTVILSNRFMFYALVPWCDELNDEAEEMMHARHCMDSMYGDLLGDRELRLSPNSRGAASLASAADRNMLDELRSMLSGTRLVSIQPHLMAACNISHVNLTGRSAWLALLEPGNLCLVMLKEGRWNWMRNMRIGPIWQKELAMILEREASLVGGCEHSDEVLLWAPHLNCAQMRVLAEIESNFSGALTSRRWKFGNLQADAHSRFGLEAGALLAIAEAG